MSQNPQINTPTENNFNNGFDIYSNGLQPVIQLDQYSSNILYNDNATVASDNSPLALYATMPMPSQNYPSNPISNELVQNPPPFMNTSSSSLYTFPPYMDSSPGIIIREIPGYDVLYIPKPNPFVNLNINSNMQQDSNFLNPSSVIPTQQQNYAPNEISAGESPTNPIIIDP